MSDKIVKVKLNPNCLVPIIDYVDVLPDVSKAVHNRIYVVNGDSKKGYALDDKGTYTAIDLYPMDYNITSSDDSVHVTKTVDKDTIVFDIKADKIITEEKITTIIQEQDTKQKELTRYIGTFQSPASATSTNEGYKTLTYNQASGLGIIHLDFSVSGSIPMEGQVIFKLPANSPTPKSLIETMFYTESGYTRVWVEKGSRNVSVGNMPANTRIITDLFGFFDDAVVTP